MTATGQLQLDFLRGSRILVVEDEYMIAQEIADELSEVGAHVLGPVPRVVEAIWLIEAEGQIDAALLDVNLGHEPVWPVVDTLLARGVPLVLATGYDASAIPVAYTHLARREKPTGARDLIQALAHTLSGALST